MKEACLTANEITASKTYERELQITTKMFKEVRTETVSIIIVIIIVFFFVKVTTRGDTLLLSIHFLFLSAKSCK